MEFLDLSTPEHGQSSPAVVTLQDSVQLLLLVGNFPGLLLLERLWLPSESRFGSSVK